MINIISQSYYSRLTSGPRKVAANLIKGLELLKYPYVINKRLDACQRLWIHDDPAALNELKSLDPKIKVLVGPNLFVLPQEVTLDADLSRSVYIQPSDWVKRMWHDRGFTSCPIEVWPVGVDTDEFAPLPAKKESVLIYFKQRPQSELRTVEETLNRKNIKYQILRYGSYSEKDYKRHLAQSRYVVWLGIHESQGLALQEAMAMGVPILVCDKQKWEIEGVFKAGEKPYTTTTAPYFKPSCGLKIENLNQLNEAVETIEKQLAVFKPREFVMTHLGLEKQARAFLEIYSKYFGLSVETGFGEAILKQGDWVNNSPLNRFKFWLKDIYKTLS